MKRRDIFKSLLALPVLAAVPGETKEAEALRVPAHPEPIDLHMGGSYLHLVALHIMASSSTVRWRMHPAQAFAVFQCAMCLRDSVPEFDVVKPMNTFGGFTIAGAKVEQIADYPKDVIDGYNAGGVLVCKIHSLAIPYGYGA